MQDHTWLLQLLTPFKDRVQILQHPPYSTNFLPSDYYMFGPLKDALIAQRFENDDAIKEVVHFWLKAQPKKFFSDGLKNLGQHCEQRIKGG